MSFSEAPAPAPAVVSAEDLLALDQDQLVTALNGCRTPNGGFDISRFAGVDDLPESRRNELGDKLSAASIKAGPLNADELSGRLGLLAGQDGQSRQVRSPTLSPRPDDPVGDETFCHEELVEAGGRPVASVQDVRDSLHDRRARKKMLGPWLDKLDEKSLTLDMPPVFSTQLKDWQTFQQWWQWDNRGKYAGEEGFAAFLESRKKHYLHQGERKRVSNSSFEQTLKNVWENEQRYTEISEEEDFAAYTQAVEDRLASHHFTQPFQLAEDPRLQDPWTTWVEYLYYTYWWQDRYAAKTKAAKPGYEKAWDELEQFAAPSRSIPSTRPNDLKKELETTKEQLLKFLKNTRSYRKWEVCFRRQELRAQWVLEQLSLIDKSSASANANSSKKRNATRRQQPKKRGQKGATSTAAGSGPRRSERIRTGVAAKEASSTGRGIQKRQGRRKT